MCTDGKSSEGIFVDGASGHRGQDFDLTTLSLLAVIVRVKFMTLYLLNK